MPFFVFGCLPSVALDEAIRRPSELSRNTWGSWLDFSSVGAGWIAFLNYNMTADQIGSVGY
jgi:hypothetical protein